MKKSAPIHGLTPNDLKQVKAAMDLILLLEKSGSDGSFSAELLPQLKVMLRLMADAESDPARRLALIGEHLHPQMTLRHFANFTIPIERLLDRALQDDDFLTTTADGQASKLGITAHRRPLKFVLDNLRSAFNVGSIFRLADCVGASEIILSGYTAGSENPSVQKTSLGTSDLVAARHSERGEFACQELRSEGYRLVALETAKRATPLSNADLKGPIAFLVGNERFGLDHALLSLADEVCAIPTYGVKNSLNVSNALSVAAYEWSRQNS